MLEMVHAIPGLNKSLYASRNLQKADGRVREALTRLREKQCARMLCKSGQARAFCAPQPLE